MPNVIQSNVSAGKVGKRIRGRIDNPKFLNGLDESNNFLPFIQGGTTRRPAFSRIADSAASFLSNNNVQLVGLNISSTLAPASVVAWLTSTSYSIGDWRSENSVNYICLEAHTSGTFATDLANGKWEAEGDTSEDYFFLEFANNVVRVLRSNDDADTASGTWATSASAKFDAIQNIVTTYADREISELYIVPIGTTQVYVCHRNHPPAIITVGSPPSSATWSIADIDFTSHPFGKLDTTGTELKIVNETELIAIESDVDEGWTTLPNLSTNIRYIEYKSKNEWLLGRIVDSNVDASYPNPTNTKIYVDPVEAVLTGLDQSVRFVHTDDTDDDTASTVHEFRADTLVWNYDYIGAWVRIVSEFDDLRDDGFADGEVYWGKITKYEGEKDIPTKFLSGVQSDSNFEVGSIYKIVTANGLKAIVSAPMTTGGANAITWGDGFLYQTDGDQFSWQNNATVTIGTAAPGGASTALDNMSSLKTFDTVELSNTTAEPVLSTSSAYITGVSANLIQATGNITIHDANTDPDSVATHTAEIQVMRGSVFSSADVGKFLQLRLRNDWVTAKVTAYTAASAPTPEYVTVDMVSSIPRETNSSEFLYNGQTPIWRKSVWGADNYPFTISYYEGRLIFGGNPELPNYFWASKTEDNFDFRIIEDDGLALATTGISYELSATDLAEIKWMSPGPTLVIGTSRREWQVKPNSFGQALTFENIRITPETNIGSENRALRAGSSVFFIERGGRGFREMSYDFSIDGFKTNDLLTVSDDILKDETIVDVAYQEFPNSIFWLVTSGGRLLSFTYDAANNFYAWGEHKVNERDTCKAVASAPRSNANFSEDALWVSQSTGGSIAGFGQILSLAPTYKEPASEDGYKGTAHFLDGGIWISEAEGDTVTSVTSVTGLSWLKSENVTVVVDGVDYGQHPVSILGVLTLPATAEYNIQIGRTFESKIKTLPHASAGPAGPNWGKLMRFRKVFIYGVDCLGGTVSDGENPEEDILYLSDSMVHGQSPALRTGFIDLEYNWDSAIDPRVEIKNSSPYPMTILALAYDLESNE